MNALDFHFPTFNAFLNTACAFFLVLGLIFIKQKKPLAHKISMTIALICSVTFLASYLTYHYHFGSTPFQGQGLIRPIYFSILISHTILAAAIVPLVLFTVFHAWKSNFQKHAKIAKITWPLWMYVSLTGVVVYYMLYQL